MSQHPDFTRFSVAFQNGRYDDALTLVDALIAAHPQSAALLWHRANCLEKLERYADIEPTLSQLLALKPDYVPAIVKRLQFEGFLEAEDDRDDEDELSEAEMERRMHEASAQAMAMSRRQETELRRALGIDPNSADAMAMLSGVLRHREGADDTVIAEADQWLDRAIALAPNRADLLDARATSLRTRAMCMDDDADAADTVTTYSGVRYFRSRLEAALADYRAAFAASGESRYAVRCGMILHDLGRFDEALAAYDQALATMSPDDPKRPFIEETRARSENNGAGEREAMARLIEGGVFGEGKDRNLHDDMAAQALLAAANAIRAGKSVSAAIDANISDDPDQMMATHIAQQIINVAHEPPPQLEAVNPADYPSYQRKFADAVAKDATKAGLRSVGDAEAKGLFMMLGQHVLLRFFANDGGDIGVATFAMKPKWPGAIGFVLLLLTGKWKVHRMIECVTQFDDGAHLSTQFDGPSSFEYGGKILVERMPKRTALHALLARHVARVEAYRAEHPDAVAMTAFDLTGMDRRWREGQRVKRDYRASIGYVTDAELRKLLGGQYTRFADKVRRQLAVMAADHA